MADTDTPGRRPTRRRIPARLSPRGLPPPPDGGDVIYWRAAGEDDETREFEDIMLRRVPRDVAYRFRGAAGARGLTHAQYLAALVALHEAMRRQADGGDGDAAAVLDQFRLRTVSI